jgi:hypothetical protein
MKAAGVDLDTHIQQEVTTLTTCWKMVRRDGVSFQFTEHDVPKIVDISDGAGPQTYKASSSYNRSAIRGNDSLSVDNLDLTGVLDSGDIDETELRRGLFDHATIYIFLINWADLSQGILRMRKGWLGEVTITPNGLFMAELRGLTQAFSRRIGSMYSPICRADLGDSLCKVPITPPVVPRSTSVSLGQHFRMASDLEGLFSPTLLVPADIDADDVSPNEAVATIGAQAQVQTVVSKYGAGALEFTPSGAGIGSSGGGSPNFVSYPDIAAYSLGSSQFTIEGWIRFKDLTAVDQCFAAHYDNAGNQRAWSIRRTSGNLEVLLSDDGTAVAPAVTITNAVSWAIDTFYHIAVTRDASNDVRVFLDGTELGTPTAVAFAIHNSTAGLFLGKRRTSTGGFEESRLNGFIDDFRLAVGVAVYTSNFTPPTEALPTLTPEEVIEGLVCEDYDDRLYVCTTAGVTDVVYPAYDIDVGDPTTDGTAVLTAAEAWARCITVVAVDGTDLRKTFTVTELTPNSSGSIAGRDYFPEGSVNGGVIFWETGANAGKGMEVRGFTADDGITIEQEIELFLDMHFDIEVGDTAYIYRGCNKTLADCKDIFDAVVNRRAEDYIPGTDFLYNYPDAKS